jgi:hypothetical protein
MTIRFLADHATYDDHSKTVRIPAIDSNKLVVCAISRGAIAGRLWMGVCSPVRLVEIYRRHKKSFHLLALHKYRMNRVESDGTVLVTPHDVPVLGAPPEADTDDE